VINFIIVDDIKKYSDMICEIVTKVMMKNKFIYKSYVFSEYDDSFYKIMNSDIPNKIYILDIETREASGIDIARKIRKIDVDSIMIFVTVYNEAGMVLLQDDLMFLSFLSKFDDFESKLYNSINKALSFMHHKEVIKFNDKGVIYTIPIDDILYVTKDSTSRKSIIKTSYAEYDVNLTLKEVVDLCNNSLVQTHRSCFINKNRVRVIDKHRCIIEFDSGEVIDLLSSSFKKGLIVCD
jgi:DNA-binding LytR/AlgR family response regulator